MIIDALLNGLSPILDPLVGLGWFALRFVAPPLAMIGAVRFGMFWRSVPPGDER